MESQNNNEHKRRRSDTFWGQIKSTISAQLLMTLFAGVLLFFSGYQGMQMKVTSLEATNAEQKRIVEQLIKDNFTLTQLVVKLQATLENVSSKVVDIKENQNEITKDIREIRAEISAIRRGR